MFVLTVSLFAALLVGLFATAYPNWLAKRQRCFNGQHQLKLSEMEKIEQELAQLKQDIKASYDQQASLQAKLAAKEAELAAYQQATQDKLKLLQQTEEKLQGMLRNVSVDALKDNREVFQSMAKNLLEQVQERNSSAQEKQHHKLKESVLPIQKSLEQFDQKVAHLEKERVGAYRGIHEQVKQLLEAQQGLQHETRSLSKALRLPQVRGRWGEMQLKRAVEAAGLLNYVDFFEQVTTDAGAERMLRPDMVIKLPNEGTVVVDSKAPLNAYLEALDQDSLEGKKERIARHAQQVKEHLRHLGSKEYWKQFEQSPEFVVMFLPGEVFFSAALQELPELIELGAKAQVVIATPTTLIALLKTVAYGWHQVALADDARKIADAGNQLYERVHTMVSHFDDLRKSLERSVAAYNKTLSSLESRVLPAARKLHQWSNSSSQEIKPLEPTESLPRPPRVEELIDSA